MRYTSWIWVPAIAVSTSVYATTYLTVEQAQQAIFPGSALTQSFVTLTSAQKQAIEQRTGLTVRNPVIKLWKAPDGGLFIVDEVVGKHELITYALGLNADGSVKAIEIMDYRESYGYEVRNPQWRKQFVGKTADAPPKFDDDIKNIGGATLSSRHLTDGIRRLLATYAAALK